MSDAKKARRERMGDTSKVSMSNASFNGAPPPQPLADAPQNGKAGNVMNNPMVGNSFNEQVGSMSGVNLYPYGDDGLPVSDGRMGAVGYAQNSGRPQWRTPGRALNIGVEDTVAPDFRTQEMMEPYEKAASAQDFAMRNSGVNVGNEQGPSPYIPGPMGMMAYPGPLEGGDPLVGSVDSRMTSQMFDTLGLQGVQSAEGAVGMNTGTGARTSQPPKK
jgi:hypothetical protein